MAGIMDFFRSAPVATTMENTPANPANPGNPAGNMGGNPQIVNGATAAVPAVTETKSSLADFSKMWEPPTADNAAPTLLPTITADPAEMLKAARTVDFAKHIDQAQLSLAAKGDVAALSTVINQGAQLGYAQATSATVGIVKAALADQAKTFETKFMPYMLRQNDVKQAVNNTFDIARQPAAKPIVDLVTKQLTAMYPTATPEEITKHMESYLGHFAESIVANTGGSIVSKDDTVANKKAQETIDWSKYLTTGVQ